MIVTNRMMPAADWTSGNPILLLGEVGIEADTLRSKSGDGVTAWRDLPYTGGPRGPRSQPANLVIAGHSYMDPAGVIAKGQDTIPARFAAGLGLLDWQVKNLAISGSAVRNHFTGCSYAKVWANLALKRTAAPYVPDVGLFAFLYGTNDAIVGAGPQQMAGVNAAVSSIVARAQAGSVYQHDDATVTKGGTGWTELLWTALGSEPYEVAAQTPTQPWGGGTGCWRSKTVGDWIQIAVPADHTGTIDTYWIGSWYGATVSVTVDGVTRGTFTTSQLGIETYGSVTHDQRNGIISRIPGLTLGASHTVRFTITAVDTGSSQNPGELRFDSWSMKCSTGTDPLVLACETPIIPNPSSFWAGITPATIRTYNQNLRALAYIFNGYNATASWPVTVVPTENISSAETNPDAAGHPNREGAALFAGEMVGAYQRSTAPGSAVLWPGSWQPSRPRSDSIVMFRSSGAPTPWTDTFNRADSASTMGTPWVAQVGTWGITGNAAYQAAGTGNAFAVNSVAVDTGAADRTITAVVTSGSVVGDNHGLLLRGVDGSNFLSLIMSTTYGGWNLRQTIGGTTSNIVTMNGSHDPGSTVQVILKGSQITCVFDGVAAPTQTVTQFQTATKFGFVAPDSGSALRWDSFTYGPPITDVRSGDWYLDEATPKLYGPYSAGSWGGGVTLGGGAGSPSDATTTTKGVIQLAGDLSGDAANPTVPGLALKQNLSEKGQASGYAALDSTTRVPVAQMGTGTPTGSLFLRDDRTWSSPPSSVDATTGSKGVVQLAGDLGGTAASPTVPGLASKQSTSEKGAANGYAALDSTTKVPAGQLGSGSPTGSLFLRDDRVWAAPPGGGGGSLGSSSPLALGTAAAGASGNASREDHVHPITGVATATGGGKETVATNASATGTVSVNLSSGNVHNLTLTGNVTLSLTGTTAGVACSLTLIIRQDATGGRTLTWPGSVKWPNGTAPTLASTANAINQVVLSTIDNGTTWFGGLVGAGYA